MASSWVPEYTEEVIPASQETDDGSGEPPPKRFRKLVNGDANGDANNSAGWPETHWKTWDSDRVAHELENSGLSDVSQLFKENEIVGRFLVDVTENHMEKMGISKIGTQLQIKNFIRQITENTADIQNTKVFNDPIHGHIELHPLCVKIIDTPQFQRLRFLKQLGTCYFVYPGATHNRFEHSIGVCHLAGRLVRALQRRQPQLGISDLDVLCVEIAGLCHDLGHGPFSHLFDGKFIPHMRPEMKWKHEEGSRLMLKYLIEDNKLSPIFKQYGLEKVDIDFIEEQVTGAKKQHSDKEWPYVGRPQSKSFLYEIVANKRNGIDVDKWDYFSRDCHMLGIKNNFDHNRCIQFTRVIKVDGQYQICSRDKEVGNLYDMFHTRNTLHRRAYQHQVTNIIDSMITEALVKANDHVFFEGSDGRMLKMSECIDDMHAFSQLTDDVFMQIYRSTDPNLAAAKKILANIMTRNMYKFVGQTQLYHKQVIGKDQVPVVREEIIKKIDSDELECSPFESEELVVHLVYLDYGMKDKNPIDNVRFYSKDNQNEAKRVRKDQVSQMLPETFCEQQIRVYSKNRDKRTLEMIRRAFGDWCTEKKFPPPKGGSASNLELTPCSKGSRQTTPERNQTTPDKPTTNGSGKTTPESAGKMRGRLSFD